MWKPLFVALAQRGCVVNCQRQRGNPYRHGEKEALGRFVVGGTSLILDEHVAVSSMKHEASL
jgi:hypothetical protein